MITDDQDVWRLKMGRFSDADEHLYARLLRFRAPRSDGLSSRALSWRIRHVEGNWRLNDGPQAVVKVAGSRKSRSGVRASIRYVARLRSHDRDEPPVFDEFGRPISRDHVLKVMEEWDLESDADNRSATARLRPETSLPERRRLRNVQAWHFIFSILGDDGEQVLEPLRRAAAATIDAAFTRLGHRVIWTVHSDCPGRPHVHAIVKSKSDFGGRLRCDIHGDLFDSMRAEFAANLSLAGLPFQASRREDRPETRDQIMRGMSPLRPSRRKGPENGSLELRAPLWLARFGMDHLDPRDGSGAPSPGPSFLTRWLKTLVARPTVAPPSSEHADVYSLFQGVYQNPRDAMLSWRCLALENAFRRQDGTDVYPTRRLAEWHLRRRPEMFGELRQGRQISIELIKAVRCIPEPSPGPDWRAGGETGHATWHRFADERRRRRVERDRLGVILSLARLADIARQRLGDVGVAEMIARRIKAATALPIGAMPRPAAIKIRPASSSGGDGPITTAIATSSASPAIAIAAAMAPPPQAAPSVARTVGRKSYRIRDGQGR